VGHRPGRPRRWVDFTYVTFNGWQYLTEARDNLGRVVGYTYDFVLRRRRRTPILSP